MHFRLGASFCSSPDVKYISKFAYKNFLDPNIFSSIENPKSMQIKKKYLKLPQILQEIQSRTNQDKNTIIYLLHY